MEPYRSLYITDEPPDRGGGEDRALAALLIVLGGARVIPAIVLGERFGSEATLAAIVVLLGLVLAIPERYRGARSS